MASKQKISVILFSIIFFISIVIKIGVWDNPNTLCMIAEGFDQPSTKFSFIIKRVYKISQRNDFDNKIIQYLRDGENTHLYDIYIRILGVMGSKQSLSYLKKMYLMHQNNKNSRATLFNIIRSIGMIGENEIIPFLEMLQKKQKSFNVLVPEANIATAIYLITGNSKYFFINSFGVKQRLYLTNEISEARNVIIESRNRNRTFKEMLILEKMYCPDSN
ncbi:MAG: hypothetical protein K8R67_10900 [Desulfobacteraceae bacterium]|nr:hypothetical protein [Desulfobacteraceae bacterium]